MKLICAAAAIALMMTGAGQAWAQAGPSQDRIDAAMARARAAGIPVALLESKIAEGKAKGVPMDRIAEAVERRQAALDRAGDAIRNRPDPQDADLAVAADALEAGVSETVLRTLADTAPRERRTVAIAVLTELVEMGHVPDVALQRVRDALGRGPSALANLPAEAAAAGARGRGPGDVPRGVGRGRGDAPAGPPAAVPTPGDSPQSGRPGGPPAAAPAGRGGRP